MARVDSEKLHAHIKAKGGRVKCPICRRGPITFTDIIYGLPELFNRPGTDVKPVMAVIPLSCDNCGSVSLIDPKAAGVGIIDDEEPTYKLEKLK